MLNTVPYKRIKLSKSIFLMLFFFTFVYPFVLENIKMFDTVQSYGIVRVVPLPKAIRYLEILFFAILSAYLFVKGKATNKGLLTWKESCTLFFSLLIGVVVATVDSDFSATSLTMRLQVLWLLLAPFLVFYIFNNIKIGKKVIKWGVITLLGLGLINSLVGTVQVFVWKFIADDVNGAMEDAHTFANCMLLIIMLLIMVKKVRIFLPLIIFPFIGFVGASSQKAYMVLILILIIYVFFFSSAKTKIITSICVVLFGSIGINFILQQDPDIINRYLLLLDFGVSNSGIGKSYVDIVEIHNRYIFSYPFGLGIGNYSNPINYPSILGDVAVPTSHLFKEKMRNFGSIAAFDMQVTFVSFLFIEIGIIGTCFFIGFYWKLIRKLMAIYKKTKDDLPLFVGLGILAPLIASTFTIIYSMEQVTVIYPLMALAGIICQDSHSLALFKKPAATTV